MKNLDLFHLFAAVAVGMFSSGVHDAFADIPASVNVKISVRCGTGEDGYGKGGTICVSGGEALIETNMWCECNSITPLQISAMPAEGYEFVSWYGDVSLTAEQKTSATLTLTVDTAKSLTACFIAEDGDRWIYSKSDGTIKCGMTEFTCTATTGVEGGLAISAISAIDGDIVDFRLPIVGNEDGCWYVLTSIGTVLQGNLNVTELRLPDTVTGIAANALKGAENLAKVMLPAGLVSIGASAFQNCYALVDVEPFLPDTVTSVGGSAFANCSNLTGRISLHGAETLGASIVSKTTVREVDLDGAPLTSFGAGDYASVTNFHPLLPSTLGGSSPPIWNGWKLGGKQKLFLSAPGWKILSLDNLRYMPWTDVDMTGSSIAKTDTWCFYGCSSLTNVVFSEAFTTFPNVNAAFGGCGNLKWVRFRGEPPQALVTNPFVGHAGMCYYFPKWSETWETYIAEGVKADGETTIDCRVSEMTAAECKNFLSAHPGEPIPTQRISIGGAGTRSVSSTKGFLWWYPKAPPAYRTVTLFDLLRYEEQSGTFPQDDGKSSKLFDGTTYTYCTETAHLALRWLIADGGSAEIAVPAAATAARAVRVEAYRVHQMPIGNYANARAPTSWRFYGKADDEGDWILLDEVEMTADSENRWAYFDNADYTVKGTTQTTPPRAQCSLTYALPAEKWGRYVAFRFVPTGSYNKNNAIDDATPYGLMELEILGELTTCEPHLGAFSVARRGWNDMAFSFDVDSIGDIGADGREPKSVVAWVEVATDGTFAEIVSASQPAAVTAGKDRTVTVSGLQNNSAYAARVIVSNDLGLTSTMALEGTVSTLDVPFAIGALETTTNAAGKLSVTLEIKELYAGSAEVTIYYRASLTDEPFVLGTKSVTEPCVVAFDDLTAGVTPGNTSFVYVVASSGGVERSYTSTPFGFWMADSTQAPTWISNTVSRTTFTVTSGTGGITLKALVDIGDTSVIDLTTLTAGPDGAALVLVSPGTALKGNTDISQVLLPDTVTTIPENAFLNCSRLNTFRMPAALTSIGNSAFSGCSLLQNVENLFPPTCLTIGNSAFLDCKKLPNFTLPEGLLSIPANCFMGCTSFTDLHIPDSVTNIASGAFRDVYSLTNVTPRFLPPQIRTAKLEAFNDVHSLGNNIAGPLVLDNPAMKQIPNDGFRYCNRVTSLDMLGSFISRIGTLAFYNMPLKWVRFPKCAVTFSSHDTPTFSSTALREVIFPGDPPVFTKNIFASSYYIIRVPSGNASWENLLKEHSEKGWLTEMTEAERSLFRQRYPDVKPVPRQWLNLYGLTGKRYLSYIKVPGLMLFVR